jgi:predicted lipoprotein with Yx(FWY)xxD motif
MRTSALTVSVAAAVILAMSPFSTTAQEMDSDASMSATPTGILLKTIRVGQGVNVPGSSSNQPRARLVFANAESQALYVYGKDEVGKSNCYDECANAWPPASAPTNAVPVGDWSLVLRSGGTQQWAFRGQPLYSYAEDKKGGGGGMFGGGGAKGHGVDDVWHVFEVAPKDWMTLPTGVSVAEIYTAPGHVIVDVHGMPLYTFSGDLNQGADFNDWAPFAASQLALPIGHFAVAAREDGIHQWALNGKPLYTYSGDIELGDSNGKSVDPRFNLAWVMRYYMPEEVAIREDQRRGGILIDAATGKSLYARDRASYGGTGGHNARGATRGNFSAGRAIGLSGCDVQCEETWSPLLAPVNAEAKGYWTTFGRPDGSKQWAYQGYAMYTYAPEGPGVVTGHDTFDVTVNHSVENLVATNLGMYWRVTSP